MKMAARAGHGGGRRQAKHSPELSPNGTYLHHKSSPSVSKERSPSRSPEDHKIMYKSKARFKTPLSHVN